MNKLIVALAIIAALIIGLLAGRTWDERASTDAPAADREVLYWVAPMDPNYRRDEPGKSPMGMDLVPVYADEVDSQPGVVRIEPSLCDEIIHLYLARDLSAAQQDLEPDEVVEVHRIPLADALARIPTEEIRDGKSVAALQATALHLGLGTA